MLLTGSPNGIAVGYFLAQHKAQLGGNKYASQVRLWVESDGYDPCMIFHVVDSPGVPAKRSPRELLASNTETKQTHPSQKGMLGIEKVFNRIEARERGARSTSLRPKA